MISNDNYLIPVNNVDSTSVTYIGPMLWQVRLNTCPYFGIRVRIMKRRVRIVVVAVAKMIILQKYTLLLLLLLPSLPGAS